VRLLRTGYGLANRLPTAPRRGWDRTSDLPRVKLRRSQKSDVCAGQAGRIGPIVRVESTQYERHGGCGADENEPAIRGRRPMFRPGTERGLEIEPNETAALAPLPAAVHPGRCVSNVRLRNKCLDIDVELFVRHHGDLTTTPIQAGTRVGYTRVSTVAQTLEQQNAALTAAGVTKTFSDVMSGARDDRPGLAALLDYVREGDTVVVWKLDRLGRNTLHILETVKLLTDRGVTLVSTSDGIDSSTAAGRMVIGVLASMAEFERELITERTALKRASSRANGTKFGRPRKVDDTEHIGTAKRMKSDGHTGRDIAKYLGVSRATLYRYLIEDGAA
jgi:DNA invertase Pin-like site-specific DNA recombinase